MSRNIKKIHKLLNTKGYCAGEVHWEPISRGCEMCGPDGGWYIEVNTQSVDEDGDHHLVDIILAYDIDDVAAQIARLPNKEMNRDR